MAELRNKQRNCTLKSRFLRYGQATFWALAPMEFFMTSITQFDESVIPLVIPIINEQYDMDQATTYWMSSAFFIGTAATAVPISTIVKRMGHVTGSATLVAITLLLYLACFFVPSIVALFVLRGLVGAITSGLLSSRNMFTSTYPPLEKQSSYIGYALILRSFLQIILPLIGSIIIYNFDWRYSFISIAAICVITFATLVPITQRERESISKKFDWGGTVVLLLAILSLCIALNQAAYEKYVIFGILFPIAIALTFVFFMLEKRHENPILPLQLLKNPIGDIVVMNMLSYLIQNSISFLQPLIMQHYEVSTQNMGYVVACGATGGFIATILQNFLVYRIVSRRVLPACCAHLCFAAILFAVFAGSKWGNICSYIYYWFAAVLVSQYPYALLMTCVPNDYINLVAGFPPISRTFGSSIAYIISSSVNKICENLIRSSGSTKDPLLIGVYCNCAIHGVIAVTNILISVFRLGNSRAEAKKVGYDNTKIREIKLQGIVAPNDNLQEELLNEQDLDVAQ